jgi:hypothetical protein
MYKRLFESWFRGFRKILQGTAKRLTCERESESAAIGRVALDVSHSDQKRLAEESIGRKDFITASASEASVLSGPLGGPWERGLAAQKDAVEFATPSHIQVSRHRNSGEWALSGNHAGFVQQQSGGLEIGKPWKLHDDSKGVGGLYYA